MEGALLLGHYLEKRDRPALPSAHPLSRLGPRASPPEGKLGVFHPHQQLSLPFLFFSFKVFLGVGKGWGRKRVQPASVFTLSLSNFPLPPLHPLRAAAPLEQRSELTIGARLL